MIEILLDFFGLAILQIQVAPWMFTDSERFSLER